MRALPINISRTGTTFCINGYFLHISQGRNDINSGRNRLYYRKNLLTGKLYSAFGNNVRASLNKNSRKKPRKNGGTSKKFSQADIRPQDKNLADSALSLNKDGSLDKLDAVSNDALEGISTFPFPTRSAVLQACTVTSGLILGLGVILRQASHIAFTEGWIKIETSDTISLSFEPWHLELIIGLVALISACRYTLLKIWPDFAESSEVANKQVLSALQPFDYVLVAFLPGISEELLFRGALLPVIGLNWESALAVGTLFGVLHLGSGRRYSFAVWATFVGFAYGLAAIASSSIVVPMVAHSLNNLVGGVLWNYSKSPEEPLSISDQKSVSGVDADMSSSVDVVG